MRLLIVDDHAIVRLGLRALFDVEAGVEVVGDVGTAAEAVAEAARLRPDVVLLDVRLPDGSGVQACREVRTVCPGARVIMLTSFGDREAVLSSILAGADGYLLKGTEPERLIDAVHAVGRGESLLDPRTTQTVLEMLRRHAAEPEPLAPLSEQERQVLALVAEGRTNQEIATTLFLSAHTVKGYVSSILQKLQLTRRSQAAAFLARHAPAADTLQEARQPPARGLQNHRMGG